MSTEKLTVSTTTDNSLPPSTKWYEDSNFCLVFKESCLKQRNAACTPPNRINFVTVYELDTWSLDLKDYLFGGVKLTKNANLDKYVFCDYGFGFDSRSLFSFSNFH